MIANLLTKLSLTVAVMIIMGALLGIFALQIDSFRAQQLSATGDSIQLRVDGLSAIDSESQILFVYGQGSSSGEAIKLPSDVNGDPYVMDFYPDAILVNQGDRWGKSTFQHKVHLFFPGDITDVSASDLQALDREFNSLRVMSLEKFSVERRQFASSGYQTFLYRDGSDLKQEAVRDLAKVIDGHANDVKGTVDIGSDDADIVIIPNFVISRADGYAGVAHVHVNFTFDPHTLWTDGEAVDIDELAIEGRAHNGRIEVGRGSAFVLERYQLSVKIHYGMSPGDRQ